jgi:hypothetical protein
MSIDLTLEEAARRAAGNWKEFESFSWHGHPDVDDLDNWCIFYTHNRDSGLLDQSNAAQIDEALKPFTDGDDPDCVSEHNSHWAWVDGYAIRVFDKQRQITPAFRAYFNLQSRMSDYPALDEEDYSRREYEATLENIGECLTSHLRDYELPDGWEEACWDWLWNNNQRAIENRDDQGGWPSEEELEEAFLALGYQYTGEEE